MLPSSEDEDCWVFKKGLQRGINSKAFCPTGVALLLNDLKHLRKVVDVKEYDPEFPKNGFIKLKLSSSFLFEV